MQKVAEGKPYTLIFLLAGSTPAADAATMQDLQLRHLAYLFTLQEEGRLSVFGPILQHERLKGIIICNSTDASEIKAWMDGDPYIAGGYLAYEMHSFFTIPGQVVT